MKKYFIYIFFSFVITIHAGGKRYVFEKLSIEEGLSQSTIYDIIQDDSGFMWFCTDNGLNRYDGKNFKHYFDYGDSSNGISSNRVYCAAKDSYGYLWFGTEFGLNKFNPRTAKFVKYFAGSGKGKLSNNTIRFIYEDEDSVLWVGTDDGLNKYNREKNIFTVIKFGKDNNRINFILEDENKSTLWIGTSYYGLYEFNKNNFSFKKYTPAVKNGNTAVENNINSMKWIDGKFIYLATDKGLIIFDSFEKKFVDVKSVLFERHSFSSDALTDIKIMPDSSMWISTWKDGIIIFDKNKKPVANLKNDSGLSGNINNNRVLKIYIDRQNIVWLGTYSGGINKYDETTQKFNLYNADEDSQMKLPANDVWQIFEDSKNNILVCSEYGLSIFDKNKKLVKHITKENSNLSDNNTFTVTEDLMGNIWIGTLNGLNKYEPNTGRITNYFSGSEEGTLSDNAVTFLYTDKEGIVWVGTSAGLNKIDKSSNKITRINNKSLSRSITGDFITSIIEDKSGENLWIGSLTGLSKFNKKNETAVTYRNNPSDNASISSNKIYGLLEDSFGNIWACTLGGGLNKFIPGQNKFVRYRESDGISNDLVYGVIEDQNKILWLSTNYGITRFDPAKKEFIKYDVSNGLQSNEFNFNSYCKTKSGEIFFGGVNGINSFYPDRIFKNNLVPSTKITAFKINNKEVDPLTDKRLTEIISYTEEIILEYNENIFTIEFSSLNFSSPWKNKYKYKIEGLNNDWIDIAERNFASFSNIPPGSYLFKVKGSNNDNVWDEKGASLLIKINPPLWRSLWAYIFYCLIFAGVISLFVHLKLSSQKREINALQSADKLKSEFLAQMSHEIRTPVNVILSFTGLLKEEMDGKLSDDLQTGFKSIGNAGKRIIRTIDLILNMSEIQSGTYDYNPEAINLHDDIILKLLIEFRNLAENKGLKLDVVGNCADCNIYADPYTVEQIFANLIDNAIKFTEKGSIRINIICHKSHVVAEVIDTGKGIKHEYLKEIFSPFSQEEQGYTRRFEGNGLGLSLVKKYCEINNAAIDLESEFGKGTKFNVVFEKYKNEK
ncbi:MAG: hypothetical protein F9K45_00120 [Melioribacteraceae bacterium]|nr:MAG: hypothetical protein F9K45_00120 [Melioribacteraceae bacterium]